MKRISIERYKTPTNGYAGCIEGENDQGQQWIMFLDAAGTPEVFWPDRDPEGSVIGAAIGLTEALIRKESEMRMEKMRQILKDPDPVFVVQRLTAALEGAQRLTTGESELRPEQVERVQAIRRRQLFGRDISPAKP